MLIAKVMEIEENMVYEIIIYLCSHHGYIKNQ